MKLILLGPPGAGKGTQAELLSAKFGIPTISTGALIRQEIENATALGKETSRYIDEGQLVPDKLVISMVENRISHADCVNGYILDGFPRTVAQAMAMASIGAQVDKVLLIEITEEDIIKRISGRRECGQCRKTYHIIYNPPRIADLCDGCGSSLTIRDDDTPETVMKRIKVYRKETEPLREYYTALGLLVTVQGKEELKDTARDVSKALA